MPANFPAPLCEPGRGRRGQWRVAGNPDAAGETPDAGEKLARSSATGADLSSIPYPCRRDSRHDFHYLHGPATDAIHVTKWRSSSLANANPDAGAPHHYDLLVAGDSSYPGRVRRLEGLCPERRGTNHMGPVPSADTRIRSHRPPQLLRTVLANARDPD